jgi:hypothetical protein
MGTRTSYDFDASAFRARPAHDIDGTDMLIYGAASTPDPLLLGINPIVHQFRPAALVSSGGIDDVFSNGSDQERTQRLSRAANGAKALEVATAAMSVGRVLAYGCRRSRR